jgi:epsilon-lactone hydrolase
MKHPRIAVLSLALVAALTSTLPTTHQAAAQASYDQTVAAQAAANSKPGARTLPAHVLQVPTAEISPQIQALIVGPYPPHMNADPKSADEWKELINRRAALAIASCRR